MIFVSFGPLGVQNFLVYGTFIDAAPGIYIVQFDVRATNKSPIAVSMTNHISDAVLVDRYADGGATTNWQTRTFSFQHKHCWATTRSPLAWICLLYTSDAADE